MGEDAASEGHVVEIADQADHWATRTAASLRLAGAVSTLLFAGAGLALVLGVFAAVMTYLSMDTTGSFGEVATVDSTGSRLALAQAASILLGALLPAGLLAASAIALRLQAGRFEAEVLGE